MLTNLRVCTAPMQSISNNLIGAAVLRLATNIVTAVWISILPFGGSVAVFIWAQTAQAKDLLRPHLGWGGYDMLSALVTILMLFCAVTWVAFAWHRRILGRGREKGLVAILLYALMFGIILFGMALVSVVIFYGNFMVQQATGDVISQLAWVAMRVVIPTMLFYVFLRMSPVLVRIAVGDRWELSAFRQTGRIGQSVLAASVLPALMFMLWNNFSPQIPWTYIAFLWGVMMLSVSLMTELYRMTSAEDAPMEAVFD